MTFRCTFLPLLFLLPGVLAFTVSLDKTDPASCGTVNVVWQGGSPPFSMSIIPAFDYPSNISMPSSAWNTGSQTGNYAWTVNYPSGTRLVVVMSDSTGVGTGGVSQLLTTASSSGSSACSLRSTTTDFLFYLNETTVNQCGPVEIYWDETAVTPVTIMGAIPGGQAFQFESAGRTSILWNTNIVAGTQFVLGAFDSGKNVQGGSSNLLTVGGSSDSACLDDSSPSSTPAVPSATGTVSPTLTRTKTSGGGAVKTVTSIATVRPKGSAGLSTAAIVGIVVAAVVSVLALQIALMYFCFRRQLAALISHRRDLRERKIKSGDVDLISTTNGRSRSDTSLVGSGRPGDSTARHSTVRSLVGTYEAESEVSPFWDDGPPATGSPSRPHSGTFDTPPSETELEPPPRLHLRNQSISSTPSDSPSLSASGFSPSAPLVGVPTASSSRPVVSLSKAQMAALIPDASPSSPRRSRGPPQDAPPGGFRRHQDAGRLDDVEELPPLYRPEWGEAENRRQSGSDR